MMTQHLEAECAVVGSILIDGRCLPAVMDKLTPKDFAVEINRAIFAAALALDREGRAIDPVMIKEYTARLGSPVSNEYLLQLMDTTPTAANVEEYAALVRDNALKRSLQAMCDQVTAMLSEGSTAQDTMDAAAGLLEGVQNQDVAGELMGPEERAIAFLQHRSDLEAGKSGVGFVSTGYRDVDNILGGGMLASGLYILAARPGMGKTTFAVNITDRVARKSGAVFFVSLEMENEQVEAKRLSRETGIAGNRLLMHPNLREDEYEKLMKATEKVVKLPVYTNKAASATVAQIERWAKRVKGLSLVIVDYLGKIAPSERASRASRYEYTTEISGDLKTMARKLKVPVLCLAQLSRANEARSDKRPQLSDLRDTGAIEQDADGVIFLYRPNYYHPVKTADQFAPEDLEVTIAKNRHGSVGECTLQYALFSGKIMATSNDPRRAYRESEDFKQLQTEDAQKQNGQAAGQEPT